MTIEDLFEKAEESGPGPVYTRVSADHPVDLFIGVVDSALALQIRSLDAPPPPPRLEALAVQVIPPADGKWWIIIQLRRPELRGLFVRLAEDLVRATTDGPELAGQAVIARLTRWQRLFAPGPPGALPEITRRGLTAELLFLRDELLRSLSPRSAIAAWKGPFDAPRDFELGTYDVEVKAIRDGVRSIAISSLEQLDVDLKPVYLWVQSLAFAPAPLGAPASTSLASIASDIRRRVERDSQAAEDFELALRAAGYTDRPEYAEEEVTIGRKWCLEVREGFPRIERSTTAPGVLECTYHVSWPEISAYECDFLPRMTYGQ